MCKFTTILISLFQLIWIFFIVYIFFSQPLPSKSSLSISRFRIKFKKPVIPPKKIDPLQLTMDQYIPNTNFLYLNISDHEDNVVCPSKGKWMEKQPSDIDTYENKVYYYHTNFSRKCDLIAGVIGDDFCHYDLLDTTPQNFNFFTNNNTNKPKDIRLEFLCKIFPWKNHCQSLYISEVADSLYMIGVIYTFNLTQTHLLYHHHINFIKYIHSFGLKFVGLEVLYGNQKPLFQEHFHLHSNETFYIRENMLNVIIKHLPHDAEYFGWADTHQIFENPYWWEELLYKIERDATVQLFDSVYRIGECNNSLKTAQAFTRVDKLVNVKPCGTIYGSGWAISKSVFNELGYILDNCVDLGCDVVWAFSTQKDVAKTYDINKRLNNERDYYRYFREWAGKAKEILGAKAGFIRGGIVHLKHENTVVAGNFECWKNWVIQNDLNTGLERKDDFSLRIKEESLLEFYPKFEDL